ncbi:GNAT family N-acetyltransferase [Pseudolactococcus reticulitermitis]|uniref:N-acetyltransferase domain-containing protein n=1 Tax=Pseudolactococcus reticulitermitis TaxID=2025039 RepID=A0A224X4H9_9LACT|nr:GNAT family protein [Lactococcus reticulitermitis]GAX46510.1 hypothetical protein RsY01_89 [Lactococcus reticulitermitis]
MIDQEISLRKLNSDDLLPLWQVAYGKENLEWMKWNGPYFKDSVYTWDEFQALSSDYLNNELRYGIFEHAQLIGVVSAYYEDGDLQKWLEVGIVLYEERVWGKDIGTRVMKLWLTHLFEMTDLPHIGFTTWSGNLGMIRLGQKIGMTEEGRIRKVRFWQNQYWDSVKFGILREEWQVLDW